MADGVKFIFKTLIKIPLIIFVTYAIFNGFAFAVIYFKLLGFSYVVLQTAVENNYIPPQELQAFNKYLKEFDDSIEMVDNVQLILTDDNDSTIPVATERRQYGQLITVGVSGRYKFVWPLTPREQLQDTSSKFIGYDKKGGSVFSGFGSNSLLEGRRKAYEENKNNNINIKYTVPGLRYYPDLD